MNRSHSHALALLQKARDDEYVLRCLINDPSAPLWAIGFHAQQAVEKALKAALATTGEQYPYIHDLERLLESVLESGCNLPPDADELPRLTPFGTVLRYDAAEPDDDGINIEREWVLACVARTISWAESLLLK